MLMQVSRRQAEQSASQSVRSISLGRTCFRKHGFSTSGLPSFDGRLSYLTEKNFHTLPGLMFVSKLNFSNLLITKITHFGFGGSQHGVAGRIK